jgi:cyanophycinase
MRALVRSFRPVAGLRSSLFPALALSLAMQGVVGCAPGWTGGAPPPEAAPRVGPPNGTVLVAGGGRLGPEIWERFVELAGGPDARIVIIPTAGTDEEFPETWPGFLPFREAGAHNLAVLHTRDRGEADSDLFAQLLREATGVWIPGGRQWRLVDSYLNTRVHQELRDLLDRGGVVGGTSAGASIQAEFLVRGDPSTNQVMVSPEYEEGFGFLARTAVDQHLLTRARENDLWEVLQLRPDLLGIGLDEGTALVVTRDRAEVIGSSEVLFYLPSDQTRTPRVARAGAVIDLGAWSSAGTASPADDWEPSTLDRSPR